MLLMISGGIFNVGCGKSEQTNSGFSFSGNVESVSIDLEEVSSYQTETTISSTDETKISALISVLKNSVETEDHKCAITGQLLLQLSDGGKRELGILAGHDPSFYEFRAYHEDDRGYEIYRVDRDAFLQAMSKLGVDDVDPGRSD